MAKQFITTQKKFLNNLGNGELLSQLTKKLFIILDKMILKMEVKGLH